MTNVVPVPGEAFGGFSLGPDNDAVAVISAACAIGAIMLKDKAQCQQSVTALHGMPPWKVWRGIEIWFGHDPLKS